MTENRTTKAVKELLFTRKEAKHLTAAKYYEREDILALAAIAEKYQRMEEALNHYAMFSDHSLCSRCQDHSRLAKEAIAFDPLA